MKKLLLIISLVLVLSYSVSANRSEDAETYQEFNTQYFGNRLPKNILIDDALDDPNKIATTMKMEDGRFHIQFNLNYARAYRVRRMVMLHEQCHVQEWSEVSVGFPVSEHGKRWRTCMLMLDAEGAFRSEWIDGFGGK